MFFTKDTLHESFISKKKKEKKNWTQNCISFYHVPTSFHREWDVQYFK